MPEQYVKVLVHVPQDDGSRLVESLWAVVTPEGYRLANNPFYARSLAWGDVVSATPRSDGFLEVQELVAASGHSTVRIAVCDADGAELVAELRAMGCDAECFGAQLIAVDIPPDVPYGRVRAFLDAKERSGVLDFEEGCLAQD